MSFKVGDKVVLKEYSSDTLARIYSENIGMFYDIDIEDRPHEIYNINYLKGVTFEVVEVIEDSYVVQSIYGDIKSNYIRKWWFKKNVKCVYGGERGPITTTEKGE